MTQKPRARRVLLSVSLFVLCLSGLWVTVEVSVPTPIVAQNTDVSTLTPESPSNHQITSGQTQLFGVGLKQGECLSLSVQKKDLQLTVTIQKPQGQTAASFLSRTYGPLNVFFIADEPGQYLIKVQSLEKDAVQNSYTLSLEKPRDSAPADRTHATATKTANDAEWLRAQWEETSLRKAVTNYVEASQAWQAIGRNRESARALSSIGEIYFMLSEYEEARRWYEKALTSRQTAADTEGEVDSQNDIGYMYVYIGDLDRAFEHLNRALQYTEAHAAENPRRLAVTLNNIGELYYAKSDLPQALNYFNRALVLWTNAGDRAGQALAYVNIGYSYYDSGNIQEASKYYRQSLSASQVIGDLRSEALARTALGGVYSLSGEKQLALDSHHEAMTALRKLGDKLGEAAALNGIGRAYEELNQNRLALDNYIAARDQYHRAGKSDLEAISYYYVGRVYRSLGEVDAARASYKDCIDLSQKAGNRRFVAYALKDTAVIHNQNGEHQKALELFGQVLKYYRDVADKRGEAYALSGLGYTHLLLDQPSQALKYFEEAFPLSRSISDRSAEVSVLYYAALAERAQGEMQKCLGHIQESVKLIETMRTKVNSSDLRVSYLASVHEHYELYVDLLMELEKRQPNNGYAAMAFEISEQGKARSLLDSLTAAKLDLPRELDPVLGARLKELRDSLNAKAEFQMRLLNGNPSAEAAAQTDKEIRELRANYEQVEAQFRGQSSRYADLISPEPLKLKDVQSQLRDENTVLVEFSLASEKSYSWLVSSSSIKGYELPGRKVLEDAALRVKELVMARQPVSGETPVQYQQRVETAESQYWTEASSLSRHLLGPMQAELADRRLLIVPDGALHYVPFEALPIPESNAPTGATSESGIPIISKHEVIKLASAAVLVAVQRENTRASKTIIVLADPVFSTADERLPRHLQSIAANGTSGASSSIQSPSDNSRGNSPFISRLPSTRREGEEIVKLLPTAEGKLVSDFDANLPFALSAELSQYRVIHLATHGMINVEHPELSGVVLSLVDREGKQQDGFLRLHEIYNLNLNADLVVLSACQTGLGKDYKGEGLIGLTRGFMYAGSKGVIATLWKVDDEATTELMKHFYDGLFRQGLTPAAALRAAKLAIRNQKRWQSPFFWAAFELHGEYAKPIAAERKNFRIYIVLALLLISFVAIYYVWKNFRRQRQLVGS